MSLVWWTLERTDEASPLYVSIRRFVARRRQLSSHDSETHKRSIVIHRRSTSVDLIIPHVFAVQF